MRFQPDYTFQLIGEEEFPEKILQIQDRLSECRKEGFFHGFDGNKLYYEYFLAEASTASVVIVHGLSEFTKKYYEMAYYMLNQGFNVFLYDQRGHGKSCRQVARPELIHVDKFRDYIQDLECFMTQVVQPADPKPVLLYSHSMGGAVSLLYMEQHPDKIQRAVCCAPMIEPITGINPTVARLGLSVMRWFKSDKTKFRFTSEFNPNLKFEQTKDKSRCRFQHNFNMRLAEPIYRSTPMTLGWVCESLKVRRRILENQHKLRCPILVLSADQDTVVSNKAQRDFVQKCPMCIFRIHRNTSHSVLAGAPLEMEEHILTTLRFLFDGTYD